LQQTLINFAITAFILLVIIRKFSPGFGRSAIRSMAGTVLGQPIRFCVEAAKAAPAATAVMFAGWWLVDSAYLYSWSGLFWVWQVARAFAFVAAIAVVYRRDVAVMVVPVLHGSFMLWWCGDLDYVAFLGRWFPGHVGERPWLILGTAAASVVFGLCQLRRAAPGFQQLADLHQAQKAAAQAGAEIPQAPKPPSLVENVSGFWTDAKRLLGIA
jgi:hypothetical protein